MTDNINAHFHKFYPADYKDAWETRQCAGSYGREYNGTASRAATIFPEMICADGFKMSVQGHFGAYSWPRDDFADHYDSVEIMCPTDPLLDAHGGHDCGDERIYGYVPIALVERVIDTHGGLATAPVSLQESGAQHE